MTFALLAFILATEFIHLVAIASGSSSDIKTRMSMFTTFPEDQWLAEKPPGLLCQMGTAESLSFLSQAALRSSVFQV